MNKREFLKGLILFVPACGLAGALAPRAGAGDTAGKEKATNAAGGKDAKAEANGAYDPRRHYYGM